jgi:LacI family transcriptional regulator, gluconate utilization system Gnt-I transcriptional repressor
MKEVAERAGVSIMTVSRALRLPDEVSAETLHRVHKAIRAVGYVPNRLAGGLRTARNAGLVAAVIPSIRNSLFAGTVQGLTDTLRRHDLNVMLGDSQVSPKEEERLIAAFLAQRPSGMVLHATTHTPAARRLLRGAGIPIVEVGDLAGRSIDLKVSYSNFEAAATITRHLIGRGYRTIASVGLPLAGNERAQQRRRGFLAALAEANLPTSDDLLLETDGGFDNGSRAIVYLLERRPDIDAVFFAGDVLAIGAMLECRRRGLAIPERVAIAGFDDWEIARQLETPLTALEIPRYEIGRIAAELILARLAGSTERPVPVDVGFRLVPRQST